ncbi:MAG: shikimate kinase [Bacteriovoracaceae bacterium]
MKNKALKKAYVIGSPIAHSLSPAIFSFIAHQEKMSLLYEKCEVKAEELPHFLMQQKLNQDLIGFNITLPLKELMVAHLQSLSLEASATGAVNVALKVGTNFEGHNTDVIGIQKSLKNKNFEANGKNCLLWGAGGAAKAMAYVLGLEKAKTVYVFNRSEKNNPLVTTFNALFPETEFVAVQCLELAILPLSLIVNTTPLGMTGKESGLEYFLQAKQLKFSSGALAYDLIYTPQNTDFLKIASDLGLKTMGGLSMFIYQALATWKIWMGELKEEQRIFIALENYLNGILSVKNEMKPIFLTGFMGAGKSSVGKFLAELTNRPFLDTDQIVTEGYGKSIPEIFSSEGEQRFRELESMAIRKALSHNPAVISLGGGALNQIENFTIVRDCGTLIYLAAKPEVLAFRLKDQVDSRPILQGLTGEARIQKIESLLKVREPIYQEAEYLIQTDDLSEKAVAFEILSQIGEANA